LSYLPRINRRHRSDPPPCRQNRENWAEERCKSPTRSVTLRLPRRLLQEIRVLAKDRDVPYQSLMKVLLAEKVAELRRKTG